MRLTRPYGAFSADAPLGHYTELIEYMCSKDLAEAYVTDRGLGCGRWFQCQFKGSDSELGSGLALEGQPTAKYDVMYSASNRMLTVHTLLTANFSGSTARAPGQLKALFDGKLQQALLGTDYLR